MSGWIDGDGWMVGLINYEWRKGRLNGGRKRFLLKIIMIIITQEIYKAPTLWLKALNNTD